MVNPWQGAAIFLILQPLGRIRSKNFLGWLKFYQLRRFYRKRIFLGKTVFDFFFKSGETYLNPFNLDQKEKETKVGQSMPSRANLTLCQQVGQTELYLFLV